MKTVLELHNEMVNDPKYKRAIYLSNEAEIESILANERYSRSYHASAEKAHSLAFGAWVLLNYPNATKKAARHKERELIHHARAYG